jgi:DnaJ-class molecular chaperone
LTSPYQILAVSEQATDADIKQAYLQRVKESPPDRDQQRFQQIQQAFETIKDQGSRLRYSLFQLPEADFDALLDQAFRQTSAFKPLSADEFCQLLKAVPVEKALENILASKSS